MKTTKILLSISILFVCLNANSQLRINNQGNVALDGVLSMGAMHDSTKYVNIEKIMPHGTTPLYGVYAHTSYPQISGDVGPMFSVVGYAEAARRNNTDLNMPIVGVYGRASKCYDHANSFSAGVVGLCNYYTGIGVYGGIGDSNAPVPSRSLGTYAGYFNGSVKVTGSVYSSSYQSTSDMRLKRNISEIPSEALYNLSRLNPVQYYWDKEQYIKLKMNDNDASDKEKQTLVDYLLDDNIHYGLLAQEVESLYPELVAKDEQGYLSINYVELIPLLIQSINDLNDQVQALKGMSVKRAPSSSTNNTSIDEYLVPVLFPNNPNPFSQATMIKYQLPHSVQSAYIYVYDMSGKQMGEYILNERGEGQLTISASEYHAGMYLYSLIADGQEIDTKRMILTK